MNPELTKEMREALLQQQGQPVTVEDDQTLVKYVLLPLNVYQRVRSIFGEDLFDITETYDAQSAVAGAAGWDDPKMDIYNQYDAQWKAP